MSEEFVTPDEAISRCKVNIDLATDEELQVRLMELNGYKEEAKERQDQIGQEIEDLFGQEQAALTRIVREADKVKIDIARIQATRHREALFTEPGWYRARGDKWSQHKGIELLFYMLKPRRKRKGKYTSTVTGVLLAKATASNYYYGSGSKQHWRFGWACIYVTTQKWQLLSRFYASQWAKLDKSEKLQLVLDGSPIEKFEHELKRVYGTEKPVKLMRSFDKLSEIANPRRGKGKKAYPVRILRDDTGEAPLAKELEQKLRDDNKYLHF